MWSKVTISTDGDSEGGVHLKKKQSKKTIEQKSRSFKDATLQCTIVKVNKVIIPGLATAIVFFLDILYCLFPHPSPFSISVSHSPIIPSFSFLATGHRMAISALILQHETLFLLQRVISNGLSSCKQKRDSSFIMPNVYILLLTNSISPIT